jgi:hypothetical protein
LLISSYRNSSSQQLASLDSSWNGFKTVSIEVPAMQAGTFRMPNAHVDVLMDIEEGSERKKLAIARFLPVLGIKKASNENKTLSTIYLLADEITAKRISLAKEESKVSVSPLKLDLPAVSQSHPQLVSLRDPYGRLISRDIALNTPTALYLSDHKTGREVRHILRNGYWTADESFDSM